MWELLQEIETKIKTIPDFKTVDIGKEKGLNSKSCPACRVMLMGRTPTGRQYFEDARLEILIILDSKNDVRKNTENIIALEDKIINVLGGSRVKFIESLLDNDLYAADFKSTVLYYDAKGIQNNRGVC